MNKQFCPHRKDDTNISFTLGGLLDEEESPTNNITSLTPVNRGTNLILHIEISLLVMEATTSTWENSCIMSFELDIWS